MEGVTVSKLSIPFLVFLFLFYIGSHTIIGLWLKKITKKFEDNPNDEETAKTFKIAKRVFNWYAFVYIILLIILLLK